LIAVYSRLSTTSSLQFLPQKTETPFTGKEILLVTIEIKEKYRETERKETEKLSTETEKQTKRTLIKA